MSDIILILYYAFGDAGGFDKRSLQIQSRSQNEKCGFR